MTSSSGTAWFVAAATAALMIATAAATGEEIVTGTVDRHTPYRPGQGLFRRAGS